MNRGREDGGRENGGTETMSAPPGPRQLRRIARETELRLEAVQALRRGELPHPDTLRLLAKGFVLEGRRLDRDLLERTIPLLFADSVAEQLTAIRSILRGAAPATRRALRRPADERRLQLLSQLREHAGRGANGSGTGPSMTGRSMTGHLLSIHLLIAAECDLLAGKGLHTTARQVLALEPSDRPSFVQGEAIDAAWPGFEAGAARHDTGLRHWLAALAEPATHEQPRAHWDRAARDRVMTRWTWLFRAADERQGPQRGED